MAIILNGVSYKPYHNGPVGEVWVNGIKRWPSGWTCNPQMGSIAVSHTVLEGGDADQQIWLAVVDNGHGIVLSSPTTLTVDPVTHAEQHKWTRQWSVPADEIAIALGSTIRTGTGAYREYITDSVPWVFWISNYTLYAQKLGVGEPIAIAAENCVSVAAVEGFALYGGSTFDYGLCVFFIVGGKLYYRQLLNNTWYDAEEVSTVPQDVTFVAVAASKTWDYRIVVQLLSEDDTLYEVYTRHAGLGKVYAEHLEATGASAAWSLTAIRYLSAKAGDEHLEITGARSTAPYGGCYLIGDARLVAAWNIATIVEDEETHEVREDWGLRVCVKFDHELNEQEINAQIAQFEMRDSRNKAFYPSSAVADATGRIFTFSFTNFNNAHGDLTFAYMAGTVSTMADYTLLSSAALFTPMNLVPLPMPGPKPIRLWNE